MVTSLWILSPWLRSSKITVEKPNCSKIKEYLSAPSLEEPNP
jgi:hypothetical protein